MSRKQEIYRDMIHRAMLHINNVQKHADNVKAKDKSCLFESRLVHLIIAKVLEVDYGDDDIWFLNHQARRYIEDCNEHLSANYTMQSECIAELFKLVPKHLTSKLEWKGQKSGE